MNNVFHIQKTIHSNMSSTQKGVLLLLGFGLIVTAMADPPVTTRWLATANIMGACLVLLGIIGEKLEVLFDNAHEKLDGRWATPIVSGTLGIGLVIYSIASPPVSTIWFVYANLVGITLTVSAILGLDFLMTGQTKSQLQHFTPTPVQTQGYGKKVA